MEKEKKDIMYKTLIAIAVLIPVLLGLTYAYFTSGILGDPSNVQGDASSFIINLITENNGYINASQLNLIKNTEVAEKAEKGVFRVETGNNKHNVSYDLSLTSLNISPNLQVADFKWALINTDKGTTKASGTFNGVSGTSKTLATNILISANKVDNYELRIWIEETSADQIGLMGGSFSGKVTLDATMVYDPVTPPQIAVTANPTSSELLASTSINIMSGISVTYKDELLNNYTGYTCSQNGYNLSCQRSDNFNPITVVATCNQTDNAYDNGVAVSCDQIKTTRGFYLVTYTATDASGISSSNTRQYLIYEEREHNFANGETFTLDPEPGIQNIMLNVWGGGGGGGGVQTYSATQVAVSNTSGAVGSGGGGGAYAGANIGTISASISVTAQQIGNGGTGGSGGDRPTSVSAQNGTAGGTSIALYNNFTYTANGGGFGYARTNSSNGSRLIQTSVGSGGTATTDDPSGIKASGSSGGVGRFTSDSCLLICQPTPGSGGAAGGSRGGSSTGSVTISVSGDGRAGNAPGGGGGGGGSTKHSPGPEYSKGGNGAKGAITLYWRLYPV